MWEIEGNNQKEFQRFKSVSEGYRDGLLTTIYFNAARSASEGSKRGSAADSKINSIVAGAKKKGTTWEKIHYVNNQICKLTAYDNTKKRAERGNPYGALVEGKAVCLGYSETFYACMARLGIPCEIVLTKKTHEHAWNTVKVGKTWYHVDVTWNDAGSYSNDKYFMKSGDWMDRLGGCHDWK